jgi:hypothetical protein
MPGGKISSQLKDLHEILISILLIIQWLKYAPGIAVRSWHRTRARRQRQTRLQGLLAQP